MDREVEEAMAVMELQEEWVDKESAKEMEDMVEILKELDIKSEKKERIVMKKKEKPGKKMTKKEILKTKAAKNSKKITEFFSTT